MENAALLGLISSLLKTEGTRIKAHAGESRSTSGGKTQMLSTFDDLVSFESNSVFDVILNNNPANTRDEAIIEGKEGQIQNIELVERNGHLTVKCKSGSYDRVTITITSRHISKIKVSGTGDLLGSYVGKHLDLSNGGTANVVLKGQAETVVITNKGTGSISLNEFQADNVSFSNVGTGDLSFWGIKNVQGKNSGTGDVTYFGSKSNEIKNVGLGDVYYRGEKKPTPIEDIQEKTLSTKKPDEKGETKKYSKYKL